MLSGLGTLFWFLGLLVFGLSLFAFIDAAIRPTQAFPAADKQTKQFWMIILGVATAWFLVIRFPGFLFLSIIGIIAVIVYIVDVRPALRSLGSGGQRGGPYGPW